MLEEELFSFGVDGADEGSEFVDQVDSGFGQGEHDSVAEVLDED